MMNSEFCKYCVADTRMRGAVNLYAAGLLQVGDGVTVNAKTVGFPFQPHPDKLDLNKPVQTRKGKTVRILCTDRKGLYPVLGLVTVAPDAEMAVSWALDGRYGETGEHTDDLVNVPGKFAELKRAFAAGYPIQRRDQKQNCPGWVPCGNPLWLDDVEYRLKPY